MRITLQAAISYCSEAAVQSHSFLKISPENSSVVNYKLTDQSIDHILKWLHQQCFLGNLPKAFGAPKYYRL